MILWFCAENWPLKYPNNGNVYPSCKAFHKNIVLIYYKNKSVLESQCIFNDLEEYLSNFFSKDQLIRYQISIVWLSITKKD